MWVRSARRTFVMRQGVLAMLLAAAATAASAQTPAGASVSASGATTIGFAPVNSDPSQTVGNGFDAVLRDHFDVPQSARPLVERMWQASPTFRRQCRRLVEASVSVTIRLDFDPVNVRSNAETVITRGPRLKAQVRLKGADPNVTQYLAHELEHILEQVDGVDLPGAIAGRLSGAHRLDNASYETVRAVVVGRRVAGEVERYGK